MPRNNAGKPQTEKAMLIKIVKTPAGKPPEWVRQCWIGIELESLGKEKVTDRDVLIGRCKGRTNLGGYMVDGEVAFRALEKHNKTAYEWWMKYWPEAAFATLIFHTDVCEEMS